jgi:hypothetical protein
MKRNVILSGVVASVLLLGTLVSHAEKWDKNDYAGNGIESGYYDADSIKVKNKTVSWTEKYIFTSGSIDNVSKELSKFKACKQGIAKKGNVTQFQVDYEIENNKKYRGIAKRYYNKNNETICTDKDLGANDFDTTWHNLVRHSAMEQAYYDLVSRYKVVLK